MSKNLVKIFIALLLLGAFVACSKPKLYGTIQKNPSVVRDYVVPPEEAFRAVQEAIEERGYSIKQRDGRELETYWQPTFADSHYVEVFGRKDFGTVGAYYYIEARIEPSATGSRVVLTNIANSFIANLKSSNREEERIFDKVDDFTRKRDIKVTNIGLQ